MQPLTHASGYLVEASGWDVDGNFFVKRANLHWDGAGPKTIRIRDKVQPSALVFLRLLDATGAGDRFPVPHSVQSVSLPDGDGWWQVNLVQSHPRPALSGPPPVKLEHRIFKLGEEVKR